MPCLQEEKEEKEEVRVKIRKIRYAKKDPKHKKSMEG